MIKRAEPSQSTKLLTQKGKGPGVAGDLSGHIGKYFSIQL